MLDLKKILKKSSLSTRMSSVTILSICLRAIKERYAFDGQLSGYIRHNILFVKEAPRHMAIELYKDKAKLVAQINKELPSFDFRYTLKDIKIS